MSRPLLQSPVLLDPRGRLAGLVEGLPRAFWTLWVGMLVNRAGSFVVPLLFVYLTQGRGLPLPVAGLVTSLFGAGSLAGSLLGGALSDRIGRRATMLIALVANAALVLALGMAAELWQLAAAMLLLGFVADMFRPASLAAIADVVPPAHRARAFGLQYWATNLGFAFAATVGGFVAKRSFFPLFAANALTSLAVAGILLRSVPDSRTDEAVPGSRKDEPVPGSSKDEPVPGSRKDEPVPGSRKDESVPDSPKDEASAETGEQGAGSVLTPFFDRRFLPLFGLNLALTLIFYQHLSSLPEDIRQKGLSPEHFGFAIGANCALIVIFQPVVTRWAARLPRPSALAGGALLTGVGFAATALATSLPLYLATVAVWTLGEMLFAPVSGAVVAELAPPHLRGRYQAAFTITWSLGAMGAPAISTRVIPAAGLHAVWLGCAGAGIGAAAIYLVAGRRFLPRPREST